MRIFLTGKTRFLIVLMAVSSSAYGQELTAFYGKGVSSNPNADMAVHSLAWDSGRIFGAPVSTRIVSGEVYGETAGQPINAWAGDGVWIDFAGGGAKPFKFMGIGKEAEIASGPTFCTVGVGLAFTSRTTDAAQYGKMGYATVACGIRYRGISFALARFHGTAPGLNNPWVGTPYDPPVFQGFQISGRFKMTRNH